MARRIVDQDKILALIQENPGLPGVLYAWLLLGGRSDQHGPVGTVEVPFPLLVKALNVSKRITDLSAKGRIHPGPARIRTKTTDVGYYPTGAYSTTPRPAAVRATGAAPRKNAASAIQSLKHTLGDRNGRD